MDDHGFKAVFNEIILCEWDDEGSACVCCVDCFTLQHATMDQEQVKIVVLSCAKVFCTIAGLVALDSKSSKMPMARD